MHRKDALRTQYVDSVMSGQRGRSRRGQGKVRVSTNSAKLRRALCAHAVREEAGLTSIRRTCGRLCVRDVMMSGCPEEAGIGKSLYVPADVGVDGDGEDKVIFFSVGPGRP